MAKVTNVGSFPPDDPMFWGGPQLYSPPVFKRSSTDTPKNMAGANLDLSSSASADNRSSDVKRGSLYSSQPEQIGQPDPLAPGYVGTTMCPPGPA